MARPTEEYLTNKKNKFAEDFIRQVEELEGGKYSVIGEYTKAKSKIQMRHNTCGFEWGVTPDNFLRRDSRCPNCSGNARLTTEQFKEKMKKEIGTDHMFHGRFYNMRKKILCEHVPCGNKWFVIPYSLQAGVTCPSCNESNGEMKVRKVLESSNLRFVPQKSFDKCRTTKSLNFDFYVPELNLCIEFDGIQHFEPVDFASKGEAWAKEQLDGVVKRDNIKNEFCIQEDIHLLRVNYKMKDNEIVETINSTIRKIQGSKAESL
ncbi:hypothetical protein Goe5_c00570 [Bacillus phage vB_BthM-Goe5]|nr:hypothetical protein Goe5_c00570 [Bacillus phage vB_BthM-Goe5]